MKTSMTYDQAADAADSIALVRGNPKVSKYTIEANIASINYFMDDVLTIAVITMRNGFKFVGKSAPASPENFDAEVGKTFAYEDAFRQIWSHEGYLLKERLRSEQLQRGV